MLQCADLGKGSEERPWLLRLSRTARDEAPVDRDGAVEEPGAQGHEKRRHEVGKERQVPAEQTPRLGTRNLHVGKKTLLLRVLQVKFWGLRKQKSASQSEVAESGGGGCGGDLEEVILKEQRPSVAHGHKQHHDEEEERQHVRLDDKVRDLVPGLEIPHATHLHGCPTLTI